MVNLIRIQTVPISIYTSNDGLATDLCKTKIALIEKVYGLPKNHIINEYRKLRRDSIK